MAIQANTTIASRPTKGRAGRREALLDAASRQINALGIDNLDLAALAQESGFSRNALYYYINDSSDLADQCLERSVRALEADFLAAQEVASDPREQIEKFIRMSLDPAVDPRAVLSDIQALDSEKSVAVGTTFKRISDGLADLITKSIERGIFRPVSAEITARCVLGMIDWVRLAPRWLGEPATEQERLRLIDAVVELLFQGFGSERAEMTPNFPDHSSFVTQTYNPFDHEDSSRQKRTQLVSTATQLFNRQGIAGTSIQDIAESVGATKGAIYHYFDDKSGLVAACYERAFTMYRSFIEYARVNGSSGFQKALLVHQLNCQAQASADAPLMLQTGLDALSDDVRSTFVAQSRELWLDVQMFLKEGKEDASCRQGDTRALSEVAVGSFAWLSKVSSETIVVNSREIAVEIGELVGLGVMTKQQRG